jgi:hypothetical protein
MSKLQCVARLKIHDGKLDEFKRLAAKCAELVRTKDTGTLQYELYFNRPRLAGPLGSSQESGGHNGRDSSGMFWIWRNMRNA